MQLEEINHAAELEHHIHELEQNKRYYEEAIKTIEASIKALLVEKKRLENGYATRQEVPST